VSERDRRGRLRWPAWATGLSIFLVSGLVGAAGPFYVVRRFWGEVEAKGPNPRLHGRAEARVGAIPEMAVDVGEQVEILWLVTNIGEATWTVDRYRFISHDDLPVLSLPHTVEPGETAVARAVVAVPRSSRVWRPVWVLTGPDGPVPGGTLTARITVRGGPNGGVIKLQEKGPGSGKNKV
jgi:hypothetical protein